MPVALPVLSPPVDPTQITCSTDRFRCTRMSAILTAGDCKKRHAAAHANLKGKPSARMMTARYAANSAGSCRGCEVGPGVVHPKLGSKP